MVSIRQPEQPEHLASKAEQHLEPEQQQDSGLAEPLAVASADPPELAVAAKQAGRIAFAALRAVGPASAVQQRRELAVVARVAELGVAAIAVQQGQGREQQPGAWVQPEQQTTAAPSEQREQREQREKRQPSPQDHGAQTEGE